MPVWAPENLLSMLATQPVSFFLAVVALSFLLEDATAVAAGALASQMRVDPVLALSAVMIGTILGDLLLHGAGRLASGWPMIGRRLASGRLPLEAGRSIALVAAARFIPGLRLPAYAGSGVARMPLAAFVAIVTVTGLIWTPLLFHAGRLVAGPHAALLLALVAAAFFLTPRFLQAPLKRLLVATGL